MTAKLQFSPGMDYSLASGDPGRALLRQLVVKITPLRVVALNQLKFPRAAPFLDPFFAEDHIGHGVVKLDKHQPMHSVIPNKSADGIQTMLPSTTSNITCDADIKRAIALAGKDVDARALLAHAVIGPPWVPAFAGMTEVITASR